MTCHSTTVTSISVTSRLVYLSRLLMISIWILSGSTRRTGLIVINYITYHYYMRTQALQATVHSPSLPLCIPFSLFRLPFPTLPEGIGW